MHRSPIDSTTLASAAYRPDRTFLDLEFRDGNHYRFFDVPAACFQRLLLSNSKGTYFNHNIRNRYRYQLLTEIDQKK